MEKDGDIAVRSGEGEESGSNAYMKSGKKPGTRLFGGP